MYAVLASTALFWRFLSSLMAKLTSLPGKRRAQRLIKGHLYPKTDPAHGNHQERDGL